MKRLSAYFSNSNAGDEEEKDPDTGMGQAVSRSAGTESPPEKAHPLQPLQPRKSSASMTTGAVPETGGAVPASAPDQLGRNHHPSMQGSTLSVPSLNGRSRGRFPDGAPPANMAAAAARSGSRTPSTRHSIFPAGDVRNNDPEAINDVRADMMVGWLHEQQLRKQYASGEDPFEGAVLKKGRGNFVCCPPQMADVPNSLYTVVAQMNVRCAMTVCTPVVRALLDSFTARHNVNFVPLPDCLRVQILPSLTDLPRGQLHHFAAFIMDAGFLVVWDDDPEKLLLRAQDLEDRFIELIWGDGSGSSEDEDEKEKAKKTKRGKRGKEGGDANSVDVEKGLPDSYEQRPVRLESSIMVAGTMTLGISCLALGWRALAYEIAVDGSYLRLALLVVGPIQFFLSLFFFQTIVGGFFQMFGPISSMLSNNKYYSGVPPERLFVEDGDLPHVTIQMPVYKEGLMAVIRPTVLSLKAAISTYEMQGGQANIFVNDDGMQLLSEEDAMARRDFYEEHSIGWVARPPHNPNPDETVGERRFLRRGKFKKASNMNYALHVSTRVEDKLQMIERDDGWTNDNETAAYRECLADVLREDEGRTMADGNIRIGDYILLVDSDTRVPADCLLDAVSEMEQSPDVAILQFSSGVMNVSDTYFENGVTWFTNLIYTAITFMVSYGDACPFVGHNAMLRWAALQDAASYTDSDGYEKYWSESHVSEDFDMSLRLQVAGYSLRYAAYTGPEFKEGVSLTVYDELARWEKYAYGCSELLFHPLRFWPVRGPFTPLFRSFIMSGIPLAKKATICAYIGTYYAIGAAWILCLANYFITGWFYGLYDKYYIDSFAIYISIVVVFNALGNVALAVLRYRLSEQDLLYAFWNNIKWVPMFTIFLGGISLHISQAILSHLFEIDMVWGATAKEVEQVHFGEEVVRILRKFKFTFFYCFACTALMICGVYAFPVEWRITFFFSIYPLATIVVCHFCLPVLLNPALMMFSW